MTGKIIRKEVLNNKEQELWDALQDHSDAFMKYHGFSVGDIKRIGVRKFLKAEGWEKPEDVTAFMSDAMHLSICPHCMDEFGIAQDVFGLCRKCKPFFDIKQLIDISSVIGREALSLFIEGKDVSPEEKAVMLDSAIQYAEFSFRTLIRSAATEKDEAAKEMGDGTLIVEAVAKKDKNLVLRTEESSRINSILISVRDLVITQLGRVYVLDPSRIIEV